MGSFARALREVKAVPSQSASSRAADAAVRERAHHERGLR